MMTTILKFTPLKPVLYLLIMALMVPPSFLYSNAGTNPARPAKRINNSIELRAGTPIALELLQNVDSKYITEGQTVDFRVKYDVIVQGQRVVTAGAIGKGQITRIQKPKTFGKSGLLEIQVQYVQAADGQQVPLSGIPLTAIGKDRSGLAWGVSIGLGLVTAGVGLATGFLIKGKYAEMRSGRSVTASVASSVLVELPVRP